jgi:hypothetical protein
MPGVAACGSGIATGETTRKRVPPALRLGGVETVVGDERRRADVFGLAMGFLSQTLKGIAVL